MQQMTSPAEFDHMTPREVRDWIREARQAYRDEESRRHMSDPANLDLLTRQHHAAMQNLRGRL